MGEGGDIQVYELDDDVLLMLGGYMVGKQQSVLDLGKYTLKYLGVTGHHGHNLFSKGSEHS